jgi:hypothetical protein
MFLGRFCHTEHCNIPSRPTWGIASLRQITDFYPVIHRSEIVSIRAVGPRWHDDVFYTTLIVDNDNVLFLEARLEVASSRALSSTNNSCRAARLCLFITRG